MRLPIPRSILLLRRMYIIILAQVVILKTAEILLHFATSTNL